MQFRKRDQFQILERLYAAVGMTAGSEELAPCASHSASERQLLLEVLRLTLCKRSDTECLIHAGLSSSLLAVTLTQNTSQASKLPYLL